LGVVNPPAATRAPGPRGATGRATGPVDGIERRGYVPRTMLHVVVNGEERAVLEGTTVAGLLADLGLARQHVAVEANREIVPRAEHESRVLASGDHLEIVTFVGGG